MAIIIKNQDTPWVWQGNIQNKNALRGLQLPVSFHGTEQELLEFFEAYPDVQIQRDSSAVTVVYCRTDKEIKQLKRATKFRVGHISTPLSSIGTTLGDAIEQKYKGNPTWVHVKRIGRDVDESLLPTIGHGKYQRTVTLHDLANVLRGQSVFSTVKRFFTWTNFSEM